jgi:hypothetical protein
MITPFNLPSNPDVRVQLREATVADAIDFADVDDSHEEELTTLFLARVQEGQIQDSRNWSAEDRRFALYWYWLHTVKDHEISLSYECEHCGGRHVYLQDLGALAESYMPISGQPLRSAKWHDDPIVVHPLTGRDVEALERMRLAKEVAQGLVRKKIETEMMLERLIMSVSFADKTPDKPNNAKDRKMILAMSLEEFSEFAGLVSGLLLEMKHGLESVHEDGRLFLLMPPHKCPEGGGETRLRYPFRNSDYIPSLQ